MSSKIDQAKAKIQIAQALAVVGLDGAWQLAGKVFMGYVAALEKDGTSKEEALRDALIRLGQECEAMKLENGRSGRRWRTLSLRI